MSSCARAGGHRRDRRSRGRSQLGGFRTRSSRAAVGTRHANPRTVERLLTSPNALNRERTQPDAPARQHTPRTLQSLLCKQEVVGSSPIVSTKKPAGTQALRGHASKSSACGREAARGGQVGEGMGVAAPVPSDYSGLSGWNCASSEGAHALGPAQAGRPVTPLRRAPRTGWNAARGGGPGGRRWPGNPLRRRPDRAGRRLRGRCSR